MKTNSHKGKGFTIIELMIATIIFSLVLVAATAAIMQISRMYYRGITTARTQETARSVTEEIAQSIQFTGQQIRVPNYPGNATIIGPQIDEADRGNNLDTFFFCVGAKRYSFAVDRKRTDTPDPDLKEKRHVLWLDEPYVGCANAVSVGPADLDVDNPSGTEADEGKELLDEEMRITGLSIESNGDGLWSIYLAIAHGDDDLLALSQDGTRQVCEGSRFTIELCAISEISTNVRKRIQ